MSPKEKTSQQAQVKDKSQQEHEIILYNDNINTFDYVIENLVQTCDHTPEQAEQCSIIVHYNGKCIVKTGNYEDLKPRCIMLLDAGLSAEMV